MEQAHINTSYPDIYTLPYLLQDHPRGCLCVGRQMVLEHPVMQILSHVLVIVIGNYPRVVHLISTARGQMKCNLEDARMKGAREVFIEQERA